MPQTTGRWPSAGRRPGRETQADAGFGRRILVLEDEPGFSSLLVDLFGAEGYAVVTWDSGLGAAGAVRHWKPDVVLLDLGLPYRSGVTLLTELKADPQTAGIPVVVVSAVPEALPAGHRALVSAVLTKPVDLQVLLDAVSVALDTAPASVAAGPS